MDNDLDELYKWIDGHTITRQKRNLNRDFSDAVPLAEILKHHYPKLVDLHNYSPKNSLSQKIVNWELLNKKVLSKLKISLGQQEIELLAKGIPGAIEKLLQTIKCKVEIRRDSGDSGESSRVYYIENDNAFSSKEAVVPIKIQNGDKTVDRKVVSSEVFERMERDIAEKNEEIAALKAKVEHLENMLSIKEERIKDLTNQLQSLVNNSSQSNISKSRFFNKIF
ncbi:unnamed protein product [Acanthoscelides obtectus]|uniref:Calponin-homology (CH) domain-containing protein n=1 Tax=Acanthoscelides obtectus TaxID=200917 RepID=A0A9P0KI57_ACAOB|nr:unnamed protein product [Acanthoscelides obtectus]CAK1654506.1 Sperm flagellar protein 1 [Acanthoscelides obtectus]